MHTRISGFVCAALLCLTGLPASAEVAGSMAIAGHGPEQRVIESLAHAFEKANPRAYIDVVWDDNSKPLDLVKTKPDFSAALLKSIAVRMQHLARQVARVKPQS